MKYPGEPRGGEVMKELSGDQRMHQSTRNHEETR